VLGNLASNLERNSDRDCFSEHAIPHEAWFHSPKLAAKLIPPEVLLRDSSIPF
jgi:hypothetical protein